MFTNNQIDINLLPKVEALDFKPIAKNYFKIILFNLLLTYSCITIGLIIFKNAVNNTSFNSLFLFIIAGLILVLIFQIIIYKKDFNTRKFALREKDITYSHGYINNTTTTLPFNRIQHLEISRSFLARKLELSTLKIYSAGESGGDISIKGISKDVAEVQYAFLTNILNERN